MSSPDEAVKLISAELGCKAQREDDLLFFTKDKHDYALFVTDADADFNADYDELYKADFMATVLMAYRRPRRKWRLLWKPYEHMPLQECSLEDWLRWTRKTGGMVTLIR